MGWFDMIHWAFFWYGGQVLLVLGVFLYMKSSSQFSSRSWLLVEAMASSVKMAS